MLTSFFGKSNPINYLIVGLFIALGCILNFTLGSGSSATLKDIGIGVLLLAVLIFTMLLVDFIIRKNELNRQNTYGILIFGGLLLLFPAIQNEHKVIVANLLLLLALRRILSLQSNIRTEKKILDAMLWIALATFFYPASILYAGVLYYSIFRLPQISYRFYLIPVAGLLAALAVYMAVNLLVYDELNLMELMFREFRFDFSAYNSMALLIPTTIVFTLMIWAGFYRLSQLTKVPRKDRPNYMLLLVVMMVSIVIALGSEIKNGSEMLFLIPPIAIVTAYYIESLKELLFREILLWLVVLTPFAILILNLQG